MRSWLTVFVVLCLAALAACEAPQEEGAPEQKAKGPEVEAKRVEIAYNFPKEQAHKSVTYELKFRDGTYEFDGYPLDKPENVDALLGAVGNLIPSDSLLTCKFSADKPTFRISLPVGDERIELVSSSQCANWAPWNVVLGGKLYAQLDGQFGAALLPLLQEVGPKNFTDLALAPGRFPLGGGEKPAEGVEAQSSVSSTFNEVALKSAELKAALGDRKLVETRFGCDQASSADCSTVGGVAIVELADGFQFEFNLTVTPQGAKDFSLPDFSSLDAVFASKPAQALKERATAVVRVAYLESGDCAAVKAAAPTYKPEANPDELGCSQFVLAAAFDVEPDAAPPKLAFFPSLNAGWLALPAEDVDTTYFEDLAATEEVNAAVESGEGALFVNLEGTITVIK